MSSQLQQMCAFSCHVLQVMFHMKLQIAETTAACMNILAKHRAGAYDQDDKSSGSSTYWRMMRKTGAVAGSKVANFGLHSHSQG